MIGQHYWQDGRMVFMDQTVLGERIRNARREKGLTQEQLSEKANIAAYYLGEIERGVKAPSLKVFIAISEALNVSADSLLRDFISSANVYINNEISQQLDTLTPKQRVCAIEILEAYIKALR